MLARLTDTLTHEHGIHPSFTQFAAGKHLAARSMAFIWKRYIIEHFQFFQNCKKQIPDYRVFVCFRTRAD